MKRPEMDYTITYGELPGSFSLLVYVHNLEKYADKLEKKNSKLRVKLNADRYANEDKYEGGKDKC